MYDIQDLIAALPASNKPLRISVRQLHWFRAAFEACARLCGERMGCRFAVDDAKLARIFLRWLRAIDAQKPRNLRERRDFFDFVPSLVLCELIADMPLKTISGPSLAEPGSAAAFWPEGYVCTQFCLAVHGAATQQEFNVRSEIDRMVDDVRSWYSFRENASEDQNFAAGFFQKLLGHEPNWFMPASFQARMRVNE